MTFPYPCCWLLIANFVLVPAVAAEEAPQTILSVCAGCHGQGGVSQNPQVPTLAGQPYTLIEDNLLAFRAGKRSCSPQRDDQSPAALLARTMCTTVADLSEAEISALAAYFERQAFQPAEQSFDAELVGPGSRLHVEKGCERCHSDGGRKSNAMAPILAGQWTPYLRRTMDALRSGARQGPKVMNAAIRTLEDSEVEALLNYYASQQGGGAAGSEP